MKTLETEDHDHLAERLIARRVIDGECWIWAGAVRGTNSGPRGMLQVGGGRKKKGGVQSRRRYIVPRVAYRLWVGKLEPGKEICHRCDRTLCFRPEHLFQGTHSDNMREAVKKGKLFGRKPGEGIKLTPDLVLEIRERRLGGESGPGIAKSLGIHYRTVYRVEHRKSWGWV